MEYTPFAGLLRLDPGEPLSADGFAFQYLNPAIIDRLLRVGAISHRHDERPPLSHADPALDPAVTVLGNGGQIGADLTITVGYTLVDVQGGETVLNAEPVVVSTQGGLDDPDTFPELAVEHDAGTLLADNYTYGVTLTDGAGGETALSPTTTITVPPGFPASRIRISGLESILLASEGALSWRLWRMVGSGGWGLLEEGTVDEVVDDGTLCVDCNVNPPETAVGTTNATNRLQVVIPAGQPPETVAFRIYATTGDFFTSPALLGQYPIADANQIKEFTVLEFQGGAPPVVPTSIGGASKIDPDTEVLGTWKKPVPTAAELPSVGNADGDIRVVTALREARIWNEDTDSWEPFGGGGGGGGATFELDAGPEWRDASGETAAQLTVSEQEEWEELASEEFEGVAATTVIPGWAQTDLADPAWELSGDGYLQTRAAASSLDEEHTVRRAFGGGGTWAGKGIDTIDVAYEILTDDWSRIIVGMPNPFPPGSGAEEARVVIDKAAAELRIESFIGGAWATLEKRGAAEGYQLPTVGDTGRVMFERIRPDLNGGALFRVTEQDFASPYRPNTMFTAAPAEGSDLSPMTDLGASVGGSWAATGALRFGSVYHSRNVYKRIASLELKTKYGDSTWVELGAST